MTSPARHQDRPTQLRFSTRITSAAANGAAPAFGRGYWLPEDEPLPDLSLYERLISDGITAADARNGPVDHVTAQRLEHLASRSAAGPGKQAQSLALKTQLGSSPLLHLH